MAAPVPKEKEQAILAAHYAGKRSLTIRAELKCSSSTIKRVLEEAGVAVDRKNIGNWSAGKAEDLARLWATPMSAGQIAEALGISRRAVLNKARRLDLPFKQPPPRLLTKQRRSASVTSLPARPSDADAPPSLNVTLMDLEPFMCRWITSGERETSYFCGRPAGRSYGYCEAHHAIAYVPAEREKRREHTDFHLYRRKAA